MTIADSHKITGYFKKSLDHLKETFSNCSLEYLFIVNSFECVGKFSKAVVPSSWNLKQFVGYFCPVKLKNKRKLKEIAAVYYL